jgi:hypothetical protein
MVAQHRDHPFFMRGPLLRTRKLRSTSDDGDEEFATEGAEKEID